jgi:hypothetical protein
VASCLVAGGSTVNKHHWESPAPTIWPPSHDYGEIRAVAEATLPQVRFRRHLLWRYSMTWSKPGSGLS